MKLISLLVVLSISGVCLVVEASRLHTMDSDDNDELIMETIKRNKRRKRLKLEELKGLHENTMKSFDLGDETITMSEYNNAHWQLEIFETQLNLFDNSHLSSDKEVEQERKRRILQAEKHDRALRSRALMAERSHSVQ